MRVPLILVVACLAAGLAGSRSAGAADPYAFATIAAGSATTCGVTTTGAAKCWGRSGEGQVGDDHRFHRYTPVGVKGLDTGVASIAIAPNHACALTNAGAIVCWGSNLFGTLGDGTLTDRLAPVPVAGLPSTATAIAAAGGHTCAVVSGAAVCWGDSLLGVLGNGVSESHVYPPTTVTGLGSGVLAIGAGNNHSCAVMAAGTVKCWGDNSRGQLGTGVPLGGNSDVPVDVTGLGGPVTALALANEHTCALTAAGGVKCWGRNVMGQLGDGTTTDSAAAVDVVGLSGGVVAIGAGDNHSCALTGAGGVKCWGQAPMLGIGQGDTALFVTTPADVTGLTSGVTSIGVGYMTSCAVTAAGTRCWGRNDHGKLGDDTEQVHRLLPAPIVFRDVVPTFNTGVDSNRVPLAGSSVDPHYTLIASADPAFPGPNAVVASAIPTHFTQNDNYAKWIAPSPEQGDPLNGPCNPAGNYRYRTTLDLTGFDLATVSVSGLWSSKDQGVEVFLNGVSIPVLNSNSVVPREFRLTSGFVQGVNTIDFPVKVFSCPSGMRLELSATGSPPAPADTTPDAFTFASQAGVPVSTTRTSNAVMPVGYAASTNVSVANGEYSVGCGAAFTASAGSLSPGQSICVRHTSSASASTTVTTTLTVGGVNATFTSTTAAAALPGDLAWSASSVDFGGQSLRTTSLPVQLTLSNPGGTPVVVTGVAAGAPFTFAHDCATLAAGASCTAVLRYRPAVVGAATGTLTATFAGGARTVQLAGMGELSLTSHYYHAILRRGADAGGKSFWEAEAVRMQALGMNVNETWLAMARSFFASAEYLAFGRDDAGFVTDLYATFFDRAPDAGGLSFWTAQLAAGMPREVTLASFMFSAEFTGFTRDLFGDPATRAEIAMVGDFFRGLLARLPDDAGLAYWRARLRTAQCAGAAAVTAEAEAISSAFLGSAEYVTRSRSDAQFVGDLYNAFLRRGGDLPGVQFWIDRLASGALDRDAVRRAFVASPEFQARVQAVIAQGCVQ